MENPIEKFNIWWRQALSNSPLKQQSAVCVSTINQDGFPESRFVDLKQVDEDGFVFCSYLDSAKGKQIAANPKISLAAWWDHLGYQVRVVGNAVAISDVLADRFWTTRSRSAKLTTSSFRQSQPLEEESLLQKRFEALADKMRGQDIPRPNNWGGYLLSAKSIEFLTFKENRLHLRELFIQVDKQWAKSLLQP